jgi:hypothetical protein
MPVPKPQKSGIIPKQMTRGLAPKTVRNIHVMIHRPLVDAVWLTFIGYGRGVGGVAVFGPERPRQISEPAGLANGTGFGGDQSIHMRLQLSYLGF